MALKKKKYPFVKKTKKGGYLWSGRSRLCIGRWWMEWTTHALIHKRAIGTEHTTTTTLTHTSYLGLEASPQYWLFHTHVMGWAIHVPSTRPAVAHAHVCSSHTDPREIRCNTGTLICHHQLGVCVSEIVGTFFSNMINFASLLPSKNITTTHDLTSVPLGHVWVVKDVASTLP